MSDPQGSGPQYPHPPPHGYGAPGPGYYQPPPPPKKKRRWGWYIAGGLVLMFLIRRACGPEEPLPAREAREPRAPSPPITIEAPPPATTPPTREQPARPTTKADDDPDNLLWVTKGGGYVGAATREKLDQVMELIVAGDKAAFEKLLARDPSVFIIKPGLKVTVVDTAGTLSSQVKLRPRGELVEFWTVREAIEKR